jgi:RNA polymerase sigma-70 factor, ECF subfamily
MGFTERWLVWRLRRGDRTACRELIDRHHAAIYGYLRAMGADQLTAEDLTQETYARVWEKIGSLRQADSLRSWLLIIARRQLLQLARRRRPEIEMRESLPEPADPDPGALFHLEESERDSDLRHAVARLESSLRETITLHYFEDMSLREVASVLEVPVGTVKSRLHRALDQLYDLLEEKEMSRVPQGT